MKKPLRLKKIKISRVGNPYLLFGGASPTQDQHPKTYTLDTKWPGDCDTTKTNGGTTLGRTTGIGGA